MRENPLDQVKTVSEMAAIRKVSVQHIRKLCKDQKLPCRRSKDGVWLIAIKEDSK